MQSWYTLLDSFSRNPAGVHHHMLCITSDAALFMIEANGVVSLWHSMQVLPYQLGFSRFFAAVLRTAAGTMSHMAPEVSCCKRSAQLCSRPKAFPKLANIQSCKAKHQYMYQT
jgi:hypothetical protein